LTDRLGSCCLAARFGLRSDDAWTELITVSSGPALNSDLRDGITIDDGHFEDVHSADASPAFVPNRLQA
jgi:hypothetical protein